MKIKEAFEKTEGITLHMGDNVYSIHTTNLFIAAAVPHQYARKRTTVGVVDMQTLPIDTIMGYGISMEHATILQWLCTRYVQDVYPELA